MVLVGLEDSSMKIFFDESGQSGCILQKEDLLNFRNQQTFAVGAVIVKSDAESEKLIIQYKAFNKEIQYRQ